MVDRPNRCTAVYRRPVDQWRGRELPSRVCGIKESQGRNLAQIEAQISHTFPNHWYVASAPTLEYDWQVFPGQRWIVPVGLEGGREINVRSQDLSVQVGAYYNVRRPIGETRWNLSVEFGWVH